MRESYIVIRKSEFVLELHGPRGARRYPVAVGANPDGGDKVAVGDCRTPEGDFKLVSIEDSGDWECDGASAYGPFFLRIGCPPWEGIGIHGTDRPDLVGTRSTRGCVRMRNEDLLELVKRARAGMRVAISP